MLSLIRKTFFPCLVLVASVSTLSAVSVSYNTTGSFFTCTGPGANTNASPTCTASAIAGVPGGSQVTFKSGSNTATLTYTAINPDTSIDADGSDNFTTFGDFKWTGNTTAFLGTTTANLADFTLKIAQNSPTVGGPVSALGDVVGRIRLAPQVGGGMSLDFSGASVTIDQIVYTPFNTSINSNVAPVFTSLNGNIDASAVPEPGFYGLLSIGMVGLYAAVKRRRAATV